MEFAGRKDINPAAHSAEIGQSDKRPRVRDKVPSHGPEVRRDDAGMRRYPDASGHFAPGNHDGVFFPRDIGCEQAETCPQSAGSSSNGQGGVDHPECRGFDDTSFPAPRVSDPAAVLVKKWDQPVEDFSSVGVVSGCFKNFVLFHALRRGDSNF